MTVYNINTKDENGNWDPKKHWTKTLKDSGGWAERVASYWDPDLEEWVLFDRLETAVVDIRTKVGLGDIAIAPRRYNNPPQGRPDSLYEIHVDNGIVKTSIREFPDVDELGWVDQFELGNGTGVEIAFDGEWILYESIWRLVTDEVPFIFWVTDTGKLMSQLWNDASTLAELATGVDTVSAIRGWKNFDLEVDQGMVLAYVKTDGTVWYRSYSQQLDGTVIWETEREITDFTGTAKNVSLALGLDYRFIVVIENTIGDIYWLVTERKWAGMAIQPHYINSAITDIEISVTPIEYWEAITEENITAGITDIFLNQAEPIYPLPIFAENPDGIETEIHLEFNHIIDYDLTTIKDAFEIKDSLDTEFTISSTSAGINNSEIVFTMFNFAGADGNMFINYDRTIIELDCLNQGSRFAIESFNFEFTPDLTPPMGYVFENIGAGITDINLTVTEVIYTDSFLEENIVSSITDINIVVTKVGANPL